MGFATEKRGNGEKEKGVREKRARGTGEGKFRSKESGKTRGVY